MKVTHKPMNRGEAQPDTEARGDTMPHLSHGKAGRAGESSGHFSVCHITSASGEHVSFCALTSVPWSSLTPVAVLGSRVAAESTDQWLAGREGEGEERGITTGRRGNGISAPNGQRAPPRNPHAWHAPCISARNSF